MDMWKILALSCVVVAGAEGSGGSTEKPFSSDTLNVSGPTQQLGKMGGGKSTLVAPITEETDTSVESTSDSRDDNKPIKQVDSEQISSKGPSQDPSRKSSAESDAGGGAPRGDLLPGNVVGSGESLPELLVRKSAPQVEIDPEATDSTDESWLASPDACVLLGLTPLLEELTCPTVAVIHKAERVVRSAFLLAREDPVTKIAAATLLRKAAELQTPLEADTLWNLVGAYEEVGSDLLFCAQDDCSLYTATADALVADLNPGEE